MDLMQETFCQAKNLSNPVAFNSNKPNVIYSINEFHITSLHQ